MPSGKRRPGQAEPVGREKTEQALGPPRERKVAMSEKKDETQETFWKCDHCGYTFQAETLPDKCPSCHTKCTFRNVTCYTPECGFKGVDPRLK